MWAAWLRELGERVELTDPSAPQRLAQAEAALGVALPADLHALLTTTDGLLDGEGAELVWPIERIAEENAGLGPGGGRARLLFFGDTGEADMLAYRVEPADRTGSAGVGPDVYLWDRERQVERWAASDLQSLLGDWFDEADGD